jgi:hypothetical protein
LEIIMSYNSSTRLTDALERDLLAKAMQDQFRFRPLRAVSKLVLGIASFAAAARAQTNARDMF